MRSLTVLYDSHCGLCRQIKTWLEDQPAYLQLEFLPAGSVEVETRYPALHRARTLTELTVISDEGGLYEGEDAFLICFYALYDYRSIAFTLANPLGRRVLRAGLWALELLRGTTLCDGSCGVPRFEVRGSLGGARQRPA